MVNGIIIKVPLIMIMLLYLQLVEKRYILIVIAVAIIVPYTCTLMRAILPIAD